MENPTSKLCRVCKTLNKPGSKFCKRCGESLAPSTPMQMHPDTQRTRQTMGRHILGGIQSGIVSIQRQNKPLPSIGSSLSSGFSGYIAKRTAISTAKKTAYQKAYQAESLKLLRKKAREDARARGVAHMKQRVRLPF